MELRVLRSPSNDATGFVDTPAADALDDDVEDADDEDVDADDEDVDDEDGDVKDAGGEAMKTTRSLADRLFGQSVAERTGAAATAAPAPQARTGQAPARTPLAERLFGDSPEQYLDLDDNIARLADHEGLTAKQQADERCSFSSLALDELGLERLQAQRLHDVITTHRTTGSTDEQVQQWTVQSR